MTEKNVQSPLEDPEVEVDSIAPEQVIPHRWKFPKRQHRKFGVVTKEGLIVGSDKTVVPPDEVYKLAAMGCNNTEIARWFDIDVDTLLYNFKSYIEKGKEDVKQQLRRKQIEVALAGHPTMLIWLGKQMLGQSDNPTELDTDKVLPWSDDK